MRWSNVGRWLAACVLPVFAIFSGCGTILGTGGAAKVPGAEMPSVMISGSVYGGQQAIAGSSIQVYATGTAGDSSAATALLSTRVKTDETGSFKVSNLQSCPSSVSEVYLVATGGAPAETGGGTNPNASLMTLLGSCSTLASTSSIRINEVTTIASIYAVASYMSSAASVGFSAEGEQSFTNSLGLASELANLPAGTSPGVVPAGEAAPVAKLDTLANIVSNCVNSAGGSAGDGSACGNLFQYAGEGTIATKDTVGAVLAIAKASTNNVNSIYALTGGSGAYQPVLISAPADWTLAMIQTPPAPTFSPAAGSYASAQTVTLADADGEAVLYYTTDGTTPTASSARYAGGISVSASATVQAIAIDEGLMSGVGSAAYTIGGPPMPAFSPAPGSYSSAPSVTLADRESAAMIHYTTDGSTPSVSSPEYSGQLTLTATTTLRAVAIDGSMSSPIASGFYIITPPPSPLFSLPSGTYSSAESITLLDTDRSATLYYTTDGSMPSISSVRYTGALNLSTSTTIRAIAVDRGLSSTVVTGSYTLTPPSAPSFSPAPGSYIGAQTVTITTATPPAMIYYTTDGSTPSPSSILYSGPLPLSSSATIHAVAVLGSLTSAIASGSYAISAPPATLVAITPATASLAPGTAQQFAASVTGTSDTEITWALSGAGCNEATCGTISPAGLFTAPAVVPSPPAITITATTVADPTKSASAEVAVTATQPIQNISLWNTPVANLPKVSYSSVGGSISSSVTNPSISTWARAGWVAIYFAKTTDPQVQIYYSPNAWTNISTGAWLNSGNPPSVEVAIMATASVVWPTPWNNYSTTDLAGRALLAPTTYHMQQSYYWTSTPYLPTAAVPALGADGHMAVFQPNGWVLETLATIRLSDGNIVCGYASYTWPQNNKSGLQNGRRASMIPNYAGVIRNGEFSSGVIAHALAVSLPQSAIKRQISWPAYAVDMNNSYSGSIIPFGALLVIPKGITNADLNLHTQLGTVIADALRTYGGYVVDSTAHGTSIFNTEVGATDLPPWSAPAEADLQSIMNALELATFQPGIDSVPTLQATSDGKTAPIGSSH